MTTNHKLRESIAVCLVIGILAFVAGAENYYSEMECQYYTASQENLHEASFALQNVNRRTVSGDSAIAVRRVK